MTGPPPFPRGPGWGEGGGGKAEIQGLFFYHFKQ